MDALIDSSYSVDDLLLDELPMQPAGASGPFSERIKKDDFDGKCLSIDDRYLTGSIFMPRILSTLMSDLTLKGTTAPRGWEHGDLFDACSNDSRSAFAIKSAMGTGKTTLLYRYLRQVDAWERESRPDRPVCVVVIISRIALGIMYDDKLAELGYVFYKTAPDRVIDDAKVIITPESYERLQQIQLKDGVVQKMFRRVDIMIADEWETTMASLNSKTMKNRRGMFYAIFQRYWRSENTQFIVMDACLTDRSLDTLSRLVAPPPEEMSIANPIPKNLFAIYNCHRPAEFDQISIVESLNVFNERIRQALAICVDAEWEQRELDIAKNAGVEGYVPPHPEYQVIIAHASLERLQAMHSTLCSQFPDYINDRTAVQVCSKSGGHNLRTSDWLGHYLIQHTSTIAAGSDYNPKKKGRTVFVFSYTFDKISPPLMAQMTFRARLPIVHTVTFLVQPQAKRDPQLCVDRDVLLQQMELTASFCDLPRLANDRNIYRIVEEEVDGETVFMMRLNKHDFGLDVVVDQMLNQNRALNDYGEYLVEVLADISEYWRVVKESGSYQRSLVNMTRDDLQAMKREREAGAVYKTQAFARSFAILLDALGLDSDRTPLVDLIKLYDQQKSATRQRSNADHVFIYEVCIMLKSVGLTELPGRGETALLDKLEEFISENKTWFDRYWDLFKLLCRGSQQVTKDSLDDYTNGMEVRSKAPADAMKVYYILQTLSILVPNCVIEDADGSLRFRPLYSMDPTKLHSFNPTSIEISSTTMKDADAIALIELSDKHPNIYRYAFGDERFPYALNGSMAYLCDPSDCPDPGQFKKKRGVITHCCFELAKSCLIAGGFMLVGHSSDTRKFKRTVPYQTAKASVTMYTLAKGGDTASVVYTLMRSIEGVRRVKSGLVDIGWTMLKRELHGWRYLEMWEKLC